MSIAFKVEHEVEFEHALDEWATRAVEASRRALVAAGDEVAKESQASFGAGAGPKHKSGRLGQSVRMQTPVRASGLEGYTAQVGPQGIEYSRKVELGKRGPHHAGPHPYFKPGFERAGQRFGEIFTREWRAAQRD